MGINIAIGSTTSLVLIIGILSVIYGTVNSNTSLINFGWLLMIPSGIVIGIFIVLSIVRNIASISF